MKTHFIERLIAGSMGEESSVSIKPAITPDVIPETFHLPETFYLPEQQFVEHTPVTSDFKSSITDSKEQTALQKEAPISKDSISEISPTRQHTPTRYDVKVRDAEIKDIKIKEPSTISPKETTQPTTEKIEKDIVRIMPETKRIELKESKLKEPKYSKPEKKEPMLTPSAEKDIHVSKVEAQEHQTEEKPGEASTSDLSKPEKSYEEKLVVAEKVSPQIPTPPKHPSPPTKTVIPAKPVEQAQTGLPPMRPKTYSSLIKQGQEPSLGYSEPTVTINIGRIDVRAIMPQKPPTKTRVPALSLQDYLKQRSEGSK